MVTHSTQSELNGCAAFCRFVDRVHGPSFLDFFASLLGTFVLPEISWCVFLSINSAFDIYRDAGWDALYYKDNKNNE
jgi:hypothetical protein